MRSISKYCLHQNFILICLILYMPGTCRGHAGSAFSSKADAARSYCTTAGGSHPGDKATTDTDTCAVHEQINYTSTGGNTSYYTPCVYIYISECLYCYNRSTVGWKSKDFRAGLSLQCFKILTTPLLHSHEFICKLCVQSNSSVYCWMRYHGLGPYFSSGVGDFVKIATESFLFVCLLCI